MKRPNILLVTTDQQRHDHLGCAGVGGIETPHLDRLATEGGRFTRAYCPSPLCTPARVSMLTGQYPSTHGAWSIGVSVDPFPSPTIADRLAGAGYHTALFGKSHFVNRADEAAHMGACNGHDTSYFRSWRGPYLGFHEFQGNDGHTLNTGINQHYRVFLEEAEADFRRWFPRGEHYYDYRCGRWDIPSELHDTTWVGSLAEEFIHRQAAKKPPWFCWASFSDPHEPFVCPEPWFSRVGEVFPYEGYREGEFADRHEIYLRSLRNDFGPYNDSFGVPCVFGVETHNVTAALQATLGMVAFIDDQVGRLLTALQQTEQLENTLIVFTSDHGEMHGHHGLWGKGYAAYDDCQRVPLLLRFGESFGGISVPVNLVDLAPTFLEAAGLPPVLEMQGASLLPLARGEKPCGRDATLVECRGTHLLNQRTLVTPSHKLVVYDEVPEGELYDLEADPNQYRNVWHEPSRGDLRRSLLRLLAEMPRGSNLSSPRTSFA